MKILTITGPAGAGKTTALKCMQAKLGGVQVGFPRGQLRDAKRVFADLQGLRAYADIEGVPSPALIDFITKTAERNGVRYLVIAHS